MINVGIGRHIKPKPINLINDDLNTIIFFFSFFLNKKTPLSSRLILYFFIPVLPDLKIIWDIVNLDYIGADVDNI